ncbi:hypothetical protein [Spirosoma sp. KNUC1025]|uniref:hypothetical protein n=1 Tax=Spirosoma sp. KNUC1025 TaxID=2894082 RepID=UPI00386F197C|nr:hypothetical protein LN737_19315 [Spirosoma sp. KNUC1025]
MKTSILLIALLSIIGCQSKHQSMSSITIQNSNGNVVTQSSVMNKVLNEIENVVVYPANYTREQIKADSLLGAAIVRDLKRHPQQWQVHDDGTSAYRYIDDHYTAIESEYIWFGSEAKAYLTTQQSAYVTAWIKSHFKPKYKKGFRQYIADELNKQK